MLTTPATHGARQVLLEWDSNEWDSNEVRNTTEGFALSEGKDFGLAVPHKNDERSYVCNQD
jgi:hypothetical protein